MRSTRLIETGAGEMLFSPVMAHSLAPGDLIALDVPEVDPREPVVARVRQAAPLGNEVFLWLSSLRGGELGPERRGVNASILRAVGARAAGVPGGR